MVLWSVDPEDWHDNHDLNYVKALIGHLLEKYNIDPGRVYMQGMSMGHMMTDQFARYYGAMLAAAAAPWCTGPVKIIGAEAVDKSYPGFWLDFASLGGYVSLEVV